MFQKKIKMKKLLIALVAVFLYSGAIAQGIKFEKGQLNEILAKAKEENKLVFVDVYTKWCGPCKGMVKNIFPLPEVGKFYNKNFINYKLDAEDAEVNGPELSKKYEVNGFPTYLFLDGDGKLVFTTSGGMDADMFIKIGRKALGENVEDGYKVVAAKFEAGDESTETLYSVINKSLEFLTLSSDKEEIEKAKGHYFAACGKYIHQSPEKFTDPKHFELLFKLFQQLQITRDHKAVKFLLNNLEKLKDIDPEKKAMFFMYVNYNSIKDAAVKGQKEKYEGYLNDVNGCLKFAYAFNNESQTPALKILTAVAESDYALSQKDYDTYLNRYNEYLSYRPDAGAIDYLMPARILYRTGDFKKEHLEKCIPFLKIAYEKHKNAYVCTDFGMLLAKLGDKVHAKEYYNEAIEMFKTQGERGKGQIERFKKEMAELGL